MNHTIKNLTAVGPGRLVRRWAGLIAFLILLLAPSIQTRGQAPSLTEYQVKALFLLNFTKYVDWPPRAFSQPDAPFIIGVLGDSKIGNDLQTVVAGKSANGRSIIIKQIGRDEEGGNCQILFVSASEKKRMPEILDRLRNHPVLTVGESEQFIEEGGAINFIRKDGKVRLEIDLNVSRSANLQISSKLLSVADTVRGKQ